MQIFTDSHSNKNRLFLMNRIGAVARYAPRRMAPTLRAGLGIRYNSTASEIKSTLTNFDETAATTIQTTMTSDQMGYLHSIGLADGYGPTALIEQMLEATHVYTGLPWWGTIVAGTVLARTLLFPLYVKSSANMAKMSKVKPQLDKLMNDIKTGDNEDRMLAMRERSKLYKEHGIKTAHSLFPLAQVPLAYGFFQATRKMAAFPVEGFDSQGAYWFTDLTQVDPYLGLQVLTACVVTGMMRAGGETGAQTMNPMLKKVMTWLPFASILITQSMSSAVVLYFAANAIFSLVQSLVLKNKHFRKLAGIPAIEPPVVVPGARPPPATFGEWWNDFNTRMKEQSHQKMAKANKQLEAVDKRRDAANEGFIKRH